MYTKEAYVYRKFFFFLPPLDCNKNKYSKYMCNLHVRSPTLNQFSGISIQNNNLPINKYTIIMNKFKVPY